MFVQGVVPSMHKAYLPKKYSDALNKFVQTNDCYNGNCGQANYANYQPKYNPVVNKGYINKGNGYANKYEG